VDLGCSRGEALAPFVERFGAHNRFVGVEGSPPMLAAARERFAGYIRAGVVEVRDCDLRADYPPVRASLTLCVLTLQFTPIEYRQAILRRVWSHTLPGGVLVLVEKLIGATAELDGLFARRYRALKAANGYSAEQIDRKALALEGVLVPVTDCWNRELLRTAGFAEVDCFWRWLNFAGYLAVKEGA
jgi:tRNA (cmo5U34)-methyltransferase